MAFVANATMETHLLPPGFLDSIPYNFDFAPLDDPTQFPWNAHLPTGNGEADSPSALSDLDFQSTDSNTTCLCTRRGSLAPCPSESLPPPAKRRRFATEEMREETARTRDMAACISCQKRKQRCVPGPDPDGPCMRCLELWSAKVSEAIAHQPCWRVKLSDIEVYRRGPTLDFAWSLRWLNTKAEKGGKNMWKAFRHSITIGTSDTSRVVRLSQGWSTQPLEIEVNRYVPRSTDKQQYVWMNDGERKTYQTPPFSIADPDSAIHAIETFLQRQLEEIVDARLQNATPLTKLQFETAKKNLHKPLVHDCLKLWVACRFIEKPWHLVGPELLGMAPDSDPRSPYHDFAPVTPIMDQQFDNLVIHNILQPLLKKITNRLDKLRQRFRVDGKKDWPETHLAYFVLINNIEMAIAHDVAFARRHNLTSQFSNMLLIKMLVHGANTLLTYYHHAHRGYAAFSEPWSSIEKTAGLNDEHRAFLKDSRTAIHQQRGEHVHNPAKELFWTSQLFKPDWRPVVIVA